MNKILIAVVIGVSLVIGGMFFISGHNTNISPNENCDKLLHRNVQYAFCYKDEKIVVTTHNVNIYKATETQRWSYDKVEVFDKPGGKVIATYKGKLYFDLKPECK